MWQQLEGLGVEPQVQKHLRMVHVVGEVRRAGEVAEWHHLFGAVEHHRVVDVGSARLWLFLVEERWDWRHIGCINVAIMEIITSEQHVGMWYPLNLSGTIILYWIIMISIKISEVCHLPLLWGNVPNINCSVSLCLIEFHLKSPQAADVIAALKAGGIQTLIQTGLYAGQPRGTRSNHSHPLHHLRSRCVVLRVRDKMPNLKLIPCVLLEVKEKSKLRSKVAFKARVGKEMVKELILNWLI